MKNRNLELKHLGFVWIAVIKTFIMATNLYESAKSNTGPLRSGVSKVESIVASVTAPVRRRFKVAVEDLIIFLDKEVDEAASKYEQHAPPLIKSAVSHAQVMLQRMLQLVQVLAAKAQTGSVPSGTIQDTASNHGLAVEKQLVRLWFALDQVPLFHLVAEMAVPTAAHWSEKYNHAVIDMIQKGYAVFSYIPLVPLDRIAKAFRREEADKEPSAAKSDEDESSESD